MPSFPRDLPRICVALGVPTAAEWLRAADRECKDGSTFLEFRLDYLKEPASGIEALRKFRTKNPDVHVLATCRHSGHHGNFNGTLERQIEILTDAAKAGAVACDVEIESAECAMPAVATLRKSAPLIVSFHDFERTPALAVTMKRLQRVPADAYKLATNIVKPGDMLRLVDFMRAKHSQPLIALGMSECGIATRILSPAYGSMFTYAAPLEGKGTAPGQISCSAMRNVYRTDKLNSKTRVYGVIADPVAHSKSPLMHNRGFQAKRVDSVYVPFLVRASQLSDFMKVAAGIPVCGFSVTIPHKQKIIRFLDAVDPLAKRIGAVNTVWRKAGKWRGTNTDTQGVLKPLQQRLRLPHASVLIAGYGGAARAAAFALSDAGSKVTIAGRDTTKAQTLARAVRGEAMTLDQAEKSQFDALVHATPLGMHPKPNACVFREKIPADVVFDMVYNPHETVLLKMAKDQGCEPIHGIDMLLEQALCQFEIWTGETAPRAVMQAALTNSGL